MSEGSTNQAGVPSPVHRTAVAAARLALDQPLEQYLEQVAAAAVAELDGVDGASVLVMQLGKVRATAATSPAAAALEEIARGADFGPSLDAARSAAAVCVDLTHPEANPYPHLVTGPTTGAVRGLVALPMAVPSYVHANPTPQLQAGTDGFPHGVPTAAPLPPGGPSVVHGDYTGSSGRSRGARSRRARGGDTTRAAVTFHSLTGPMTPLVLAAAQALVDAVLTTAVANAVLHEGMVRRGDQLAEAAARRAEIEQAKGVLMAIHQIDADAAYARLSTTSQSTNTKLHDLAVDILTKTTGAASPTNSS